MENKNQKKKRTNKNQAKPLASGAQLKNRNPRRRGRKNNREEVEYVMKNVAPPPMLPMWHKGNQVGRLNHLQNKLEKKEKEIISHKKKWTQHEGRNSYGSGHTVTAHSLSNNDLNKYSKCLQYPEYHMCRVPFLVGVPTAICRQSSIFTWTNAGRGSNDIDGHPGSHDIFAFSFAPSAQLLTIGTSGNLHDVSAPFQWSTQLNKFGICHANKGHEGYVDTSTLFPQLQRDAMSMARVVASSVQVERTDAVINRAGNCTVCRIYGAKPYNHDSGSLEDRAIRVLNPRLMDTAAYKNVNDFGDPSALGYMTTCPIDYSDLDMIELGSGINAQNTPESVIPSKSPVINGYVDNIAYDPKVKLRIRFDVVIEYCPNEDIKQMVETKETTQNTAQIEAAFNKNSEVRNAGETQTSMKQIANFAREGFKMASNPVGYMIDKVVDGVGTKDQRAYNGALDLSKANHPKIGKSMLLKAAQIRQSRVVDLSVVGVPTNASRHIADDSQGDCDSNKAPNPIVDNTVQRIHDQIENSRYITEIDVNMRKRNAPQDTKQAKNY